MARKIAFLGGGNMGSSLVGGLVESGHPPAAVLVSEPEAEKRRDLAERFAVGVTTRVASIYPRRGIAVTE